MRDSDNPKLNITPSQGFDIEGIFILYDSNENDSGTITNGLINGALKSSDFCESDDNIIYTIAKPFLATKFYPQTAAFRIIILIKKLSLVGIPN